MNITGPLSAITVLTLVGCATAMSPELLSCPVPADAGITTPVRSAAALPPECGVSDLRTKIDWDAEAALPLSLEPSQSIARVVVRGDTAKVYVDAHPYCGGAPPGPPMVVFLRVPRSTTSVQKITRQHGRCPPGPPRP